MGWIQILGAYPNTKICIEYHICKSGFGFAPTTAPITPLLIYMTRLAASWGILLPAGFESGFRAVGFGSTHGWISIRLDSDSGCLDSDTRCPDSHITVVNTIHSIGQSLLTLKVVLGGSQRFPDNHDLSICHRLYDFPLRPLVAAKNHLPPTSLPV